MIHPIIYFLVPSLLTYLAQVRAIQHNSLTLRTDECRAGEPGSVLIRVMTPAEGPGFPEMNYDTKYTAKDATGCLKRGYLLEKAAGGQKNFGIFSLISPDNGGHCLVYATEDCADNTGMMLLNPLNLDLEFPNKIICPGVASDMIPPDFRGLKCFSYNV